MIPRHLLTFSMKGSRVYRKMVGKVVRAMDMRSRHGAAVVRAMDMRLRHGAAVVRRVR